MKKRLVLLSVSAIMFLTGCVPSFFGGFSGIVAPNTSNKFFYEEPSDEELLDRKFKSVEHFFREFGRDGSRCDFEGCKSILEGKRRFCEENLEEAKRRGLL